MQDVLRVADLELDASRHRAFRGRVRINLTTKEFALLHLLMRRNGDVITRTQIISLIWDMNFDNDSNVVEVAICRLRAKIDDGFDLKLIHTIRGVGYVLKRADDATRPTVAAPGPAGRRPRRAAGPGARRDGALGTSAAS